MSERRQVNHRKLIHELRVREAAPSVYVAVLYVAEFGDVGTPRMGYRRLGEILPVSKNTAAKAVDLAISGGWFEAIPDGNSFRFRLADAWLRTPQKLGQSNGNTGQTAPVIDPQNDPANDPKNGAFSDARSPESGNAPEVDPKNGSDVGAFADGTPVATRARVDRTSPTGKSEGKRKKSSPTHTQPRETQTQRAYREYVDHCKTQPEGWRAVMRTLLDVLKYRNRLRGLQVKGGERPVNRYVELVACADWCAAEGHTPDDLVVWNRRRWADPWYGRNGKRVKATPETVMDEWERWMYEGSDDDFDEDGARIERDNGGDDGLSRRDKRQRRKITELADELGVGPRGAGAISPADSGESVPRIGSGVAGRSGAATPGGDVARGAGLGTGTDGEARRIVPFRHG